MYLDLPLASAKFSRNSLAITARRREDENQNPQQKEGRDCRERRREILTFVAVEIMVFHGLRVWV